jgi:hypothetical protein
VSKFHLSQFTDPESFGTNDPWLWLGSVIDRSIRRRAPKNVGTVNLAFDGPGGLADRDATLESFLAKEVEGPAALAMREVCRWPSGTAGSMPAALLRYLAWAAARSLPMQDLEHCWLEKGFGNGGDVVEPPPEGLLNGSELQRDVKMCHSTLGSRVFRADDDFEKLQAEGWFPDMHDRANFLESVHIQAYCFQVRFFPRLKWFALHAPRGDFFVIADRAVGWVADGIIDAPPSSLRDPSAYVLAPISRSLLLVGRHTTTEWQVTTGQVNAVMTSWAHERIAGPTQTTVKFALEARAAAM